MKTLIILAAGNGSRFGGPKQLTCFGPLNRPLMSYNIDHAHQAGYRKFIIVCQQKHEQLIQTLPLYQHFSDSEYHTVIQKNQSLPDSLSKKIGHSKPLGTAHALWCCHNLIDDNFTVINGDDYYGAHAFTLLYNANLHNKSQHYLVGYPLKNTLSAHGGVNRGICSISKNNTLLEISEVTNIRQSPKGIISDTKNNRASDLNDNDLVSMNCWSFHPQIFDTLAELISHSLSSLNNQQECYLPDAAMKAINDEKACIEVLTSHDEWFGVTYAADSDIVHNKLALLTEKGLFH
ncbi:nucleotidyltransferase family protein [Thalassotalea profundi]|uniref:Nucleotidyl transferase domain-containing protein n=1 Tax=Thalassotalea profundi TaxID=2036687 RepID=A0ABQ3IWE2_9GAMM|nr:sugar phosphate nucleotidyltransferase [Thalassotalea profundi]GHE91943.1 hypothetical protein GCM10011501_21790 [Thalassotalea profundi]